MGTAPGSETLQGTVTGWTSYSRSTPLSSGASLPLSNNTACGVAFSDQLEPTGTWYTVNLLNKFASRIAGYPQTWCTFGGSAGTINVSNGTPTGNCGINGFNYPQSIVTTPALQAQQSILGPLQVQSLTCTGTPCGSVPSPSGVVINLQDHGIVPDMVYLGGLGNPNNLSPGCVTMSNGAR